MCVCGGGGKERREREKQCETHTQMYKHTTSVVSYIFIKKSIVQEAWNKVSPPGTSHQGSVFKLMESQVFIWVGLSFYSLFNFLLASPVQTHYCVWIL